MKRKPGRPHAGHRGRVTKRATDSKRLVLIQHDMSTGRYVPTIMERSSLDRMPPQAKQMYQLNMPVSFYSSIDQDLYSCATFGDAVEATEEMAKRLTKETGIVHAVVATKAISVDHAGPLNLGMADSS